MYMYDGLISDEVLDLEAWEWQELEQLPHKLVLVQYGTQHLIAK